MLHVVYTPKQLRHRARGRIALLHRERKPLVVEGTFDEYRYCAGHRHAEVGKELVGPRFVSSSILKFTCAMVLYLLCAGMIPKAYLQCQVDAIQFEEL